MILALGQETRQREATDAQASHEGGEKDAEGDGGRANDEYVASPTPQDFPSLVQAAMVAAPTVSHGGNGWRIFCSFLPVPDVFGLCGDRGCEWSVWNWPRISK